MTQKQAKGYSNVLKFSFSMHVSYIQVRNGKSLVEIRASCIDGTILIFSVLCGIVTKKKRKVMYQSKQSSELDRHDLQIYEVYTCLSSVKIRKSTKEYVTLIIGLYKDNGSVLHVVIRLLYI